MDTLSKNLEKESLETSYIKVIRYKTHLKIIRKLQNR